jgi:hypothetical protein
VTTISAPVSYIWFALTIPDLSRRGVYSDIDMAPPPPVQQ